MATFDDAVLTEIRKIGRRIGWLRIDRGWTQEAFAERLGVSVDYVQRLERGTNLTVRSLLKVATTLGVAPVELWTTPVAPPAATGRPPKSRPGV